MVRAHNPQLGGCGFKNSWRTPISHEGVHVVCVLHASGHGGCHTVTPTHRMTSATRWVLSIFISDQCVTKTACIWILKALSAEISQVGTLAAMDIKNSDPALVHGSPNNHEACSFPTGSYWYLGMCVTFLRKEKNPGQGHYSEMQMRNDVFCITLSRWYHRSLSSYWPLTFY